MFAGAPRRVGGAGGAVINAPRDPRATPFRALRYSGEPVDSDFGAVYRQKWTLFLDPDW
jgi:hypothetical protein